ncbi:hypothetical protein NSQ77_19925 [Oceanobacillus sp. FSL K6-2867]|uniref:hypothetical protein n=1 Tax=Oceanobacillus sp. FSL K6-2867 TaxID=2954748 RepID=UPI0030D7135F
MIKKITNWHRFSFNMQSEHFYNYIETMEGSIESHKNSLEKRFEEQSKDIKDPAIKQEFYEHAFLDDYHDLDKTYTLILRKSLFISLYSFMESELRSIAKNIEKQNLTNKKLADFNDRGIYLYLVYLEKTNKININISKENRKKFKEYNNLRNYFVHNDNNSINQKQYDKLKILPYLAFEKFPHKDYTNYQVEALEKDFNPHYLNLISLFFDELFKGIEESNITL